VTHSTPAGSSPALAVWGWRHPLGWRPAGGSGWTWAAGGTGPPLTSLALGLLPPTTCPPGHTQAAAAPPGGPWPAGGR